MWSCRECIVLFWIAVQCSGTMTSSRLTRVHRISLWVFILSAISTVISFYSHVEFHAGRRRSTEVYVDSFLGSASVNVLRFADHPPAPSWIFTARTESLGQFPRPSVAPVPGWEEHNYGLLRTSVRRVGGIITVRSYALILPFLQIVMAVAAGITWYRCRVVLRRRRGWAAAECCTRCGYDLRASPNRCPECGMPVVPNYAPICWREPHWSYAARRATRPYRVMLRDKVIELVVLIGIIGTCLTIMAMLPSDSNKDEKRFAQVVTVVLLTSILLPILSIGLFRALRPPTVWLADNCIKPGADPAIPGRAVVSWKDVHAVEIMSDDQQRPILQMTIAGIISSRPDSIVTRAIAPEIDCDDLAQRIAAWTALKSTGASEGKPTLPGKPDAPGNPSQN